MNGLKNWRNLDLMVVFAAALVVTAATCTMAVVLNDNTPVVVTLTTIMSGVWGGLLTLATRSGTTSTVVPPKPEGEGS